MCQYSLEGYPSRAAKDQEQLALRSLGSGHQGFANPKDHKVGGHTLLVCVKPGTEMTLDVVMFRDEVMSVIPHPTQLHDINRCKLWQGRTGVVVKMASYGRGQHYNDALRFPDGTKVPLLWFQVGMKASVGIKRDLDKALGLDQLRAEVPKQAPKEYTEPYAAGLARLFRL